MIPTEFVAIIIVSAIVLIFVLSIKNVQLSTKVKVWRGLSEDSEIKNIELKTKCEELEKLIPKVPKSNLQECQLLCYSRDLNEIGIDSDEWMDYIFDWNDVVGIKVTQVDSKNYNITVIYIYGLTFVTDIPFELAREKWNLIKRSIDNSI